MDLAHWCWLRICKFMGSSTPPSPCYTYFDTFFYSLKGIMGNYCKSEWAHCSWQPNSLCHAHTHTHTYHHTDLFTVQTQFSAQLHGIHGRMAPDMYGSSGGYGCILRIRRVLQAAFIRTRSCLPICSYQIEPLNQLNNCISTEKDSDVSSPLHVLPKLK